jgi:adenylate kinase
MVTGVCGVGKSTITQELSRNLNLTWGDYADLMLEVMGETDKDKIQYLDWEKRRSIYNRVENLIASRFSKESSDGRIHLLENHLTIVQDGAVVSFPVGDYEKYNLIGLVSVTASPQSILERRLKDPSRKRLMDTSELIEKQQRVNAEEAVRVSGYLGIPLMEIINNDGKPPVLEIQRWARDIIFGENKVKHPERS